MREMSELVSKTQYILNIKPCRFVQNYYMHINYAVLVSAHSMPPKNRTRNLLLAPHPHLKLVVRIDCFDFWPMKHGNTP